MDFSSPESNNVLTPMACAPPLRADWIGLAGLFLLTCFAWIPDSYYKMVGWPWIILWQVGFWGLAVSCCYRLRIFDQPFRLLGFGLDWAIIGLVVSLGLSSLTAQFPGLAAQNSLMVLFYIIALYGVRNSTVPWLRGDNLMQALVGMGAISSIISLIFWQPSSAMWLSSEFNEALRNRFPLGHHNFAGGFWVLLMPLAAGLTLNQTGWRRWLNGVASLILSIALYSSGSRGAWLGAIIMVLMTLGNKLLQRNQSHRWRFALSSVLILGVITLLVLSNPRVRNLTQVKSLTEPSGLSITRLRDGPTIDRFYMAQASGNLLKDHPFLGVGPGNLGRVYDLYRPIEAGAGLDQVQQLHNLPLQLLAELGIVGAVTYLWGLICGGRLWWALHKHSDSRLIHPIGLSFVGYGVSSLTDYQLENIPISIAVVGLVALLVQESDRWLGCCVESKNLGQVQSLITGHYRRDAPIESVNELSAKSRRLASLMVLVLLGISLQFWVRNTLAIALTHQGLRAIQSDKFIQADTQFYRAAKVAPWDPTPSALAAEHLIELVQESDSSETQTTLLTEARNLYQQALKAAPNDIWFNNNLAVLALPDSPDLASAQARKTIQLSPRNRNYSYYLLGLTYLDQGQTEQAIDAFALESLVHPSFALLPMWDSAEFVEMRSQFFDHTVQNYNSLLSRLSPQSRFYQQLYEHIQLVRWWSRLDGETPKFNGSTTSGSSLRPLTQALLQIESDPDQALDILNRCIADLPSQVSACGLLRAWLKPDDYLAEYLEIVELKDDEKEQVKVNIQTHRALKDWLKSTTTYLSERQRFSLALIYRNLYANSILAILRPTPLRAYTLVDLLTLAPSMPRDFPTLDLLLETLRTEKLSLSHPTRNQFQLMP